MHAGKRRLAHKAGAKQHPGIQQEEEVAVATIGEITPVAVLRGEALVYLTVVPEEKTY